MQICNLWPTVYQTEYKKYILTNDYKKFIYLSKTASLFYTKPKTKKITINKASYQMYCLQVRRI